jgi:hypothetical protein
MKAAWKGHLQLFLVLIEKGADINMPNKVRNSVVKLFEFLNYF